jgi:LmbE family N-acetylglucosaminyl deacetylase
VAGLALRARNDPALITMLVVGANDLQVSRVLCIGAHSDDIEIGCSGMLLTLLQRGPLSVTWLVLSGSGNRAQEARDSATQLVGDSSLDFRIEAFRESYFPYQGADIKERFDALGKEVEPDLVFAPHLQDANQDHRLVAELVANTFRDHLILEYEIPKYDGDLGNPAIYAHLSADVAARKVRHLMDAFPSQRPKPWYTEETFRAVLRLRGIECRAPDGYAEAFHCRKLVLV